MGSKDYHPADSLSHFRRRAEAAEASLDRLRPQIDDVMDLGVRLARELEERAKEVVFLRSILAPFAEAARLLQDDATSYGVLLLTKDGTQSALLDPQAFRDARAALSRTGEGAADGPG